ncbi:MAG: transposase [Woeseiaceae bacterium]|nr:transposase [Woeseiaceae bacterium]
MHVDSDIRQGGIRQLRKGRYSVSGQIYHVTAVTCGRQPIFEDLFSGRIVVKCLMHEAVHARAQTLCFVVMPDHLHWLLQLDGRRSLSAVMQNVKCQSARRIKLAGRTLPKVWQPGFYDRAIRRDEDLAAIARYIVANPQRAGISKSCREYSLWDAVWL